MKSTFLLSSNIVPQEMSMNGCDWLRLERWTRDLTKAYEHVHVVSGPLWLAEKDVHTSTMRVNYQVLSLFLLHFLPFPFSKLPCSLP